MESKSTIQEIIQLATGYTSSQQEHTCLICQQKYVLGQIYPYEDKWFDATKRMEKHIEEAHGGMLSYYLQSNPDLLGITSLQQEILQLFAQRFSDKEIAKRQSIALSTIRNYRYKLREKEKQAQYFLATMHLLQEHTKLPVETVGSEILVEVPNTATTRDERFNITQKEKEVIRAQYFDEHGALKEYPAKAKRKVIVLEVIAGNFKQDVFYHEIEVTRILARIYEDHVTIRRALIEYGFLDRNNDGSRYWLKQ